MIIHRKAGPTPIDATRFRSWAGLAVELGLERDELARRCVFADVALGAWRGHWIGRELYAQLGLTFSDELQPRMGARDTGAHSGGYFGDLTDNEARGDYNLLLAYRAAVEILTEIQRRALAWIIIIAPRPPLAAWAPSWSTEDLAIVRFLAQGCEAVGCRIRLVFVSRSAPDGESGGLALRWQGGADDDAPAVTGTTLGMVPGVLPSILETTGVAPGDLLALADGRALLSPLLRGEPPASVREWLLELVVEQLPPVFEWLQAYAVACEERPPADGDAGALVSSAIDRFSEGGHELALWLLGQARRRARSERLRAVSDSVRQHMLLRMRDFVEAARGPLPGDDLPPAMRLGLLQSKGWAFTMIGKAAEAEPLLEQARGLMTAQPDPRAQLYLLNISALNQLRLGRFDSALAMEKTIEQSLAAGHPTDWHATYINSINQARLYKKGGDLATAEAYYRRAFTIIDGLRSDGDLLYHELCFAQLEAKHGRHRATLLRWLRAALHWLSSELPEALAPRVAEAITQGRGLARKEAIVEQVSAGLRVQLDAAWTAANGVEPDDPRRAAATGATASLVEAPFFVAVDAVPRRASDRAIGADGFGLFVRAESRPPRFLGDQYVGLSRDVWRCVRALSGLSGLPETCTVLIDDQCGSELPTNLDELAGSCLRVGATELVFAGQAVDVSDPAIVARARVSLVPGVDQLRLDGEAPVVTFKRYRKPLPLTSAQAEVLGQLTDTSTVGVLEASHGRDVLTVLRALEAQHVVRLTVSLLA